MKFKQKQKILALIICFVSADIYAGMNGIIMPQAKSRTKTNKAFQPSSTSNNSNSVSQSAATVASPIAAKTSTSTVDPVIMSKIRADFNSALDGGVIPKTGESMPWANGTLTRTASNELKYVNSNNGYYEANFTKDSDLERLAKDNGDIRNTWIAQYGVNLAGLDESANQLDAFKNQVTHLYMYGLSDSYNKENPWPLGLGLGAYKKDGNVVFYNKDGPISYNDLLKTNEYKALAGTNILHTETEAPPIVPAMNPVNNLDYIGSANNSSIDMLITASAKYKAGTITKDQYISVALQVSQMADYFKKVNSPTPTSSLPTAAPVSSSAAATNTSNTNNSSAGQRVLIGTANNGEDKIYSVKMNSWDQKYGYKVVIVPGKPIVSTEYDLTVPYVEIKPGSNEIENILNNIPSDFKVDKSADNKPVVKNDPSAAGLWRMTKESAAVCVHSAERISQPSGSCTIGATAQSSSGAGWANDKRPAEKNCIEKGYEKVKYDYEFTCIADIYQNAGGM